MPDFINEHVIYFIADEHGEIHKLFGRTQLQSFIEKHFSDSLTQSFVVAKTNLVCDLPEFETVHYAAPPMPLRFRTFNNPATVSTDALLAQAEKHTEQFSGSSMLINIALREKQIDSLLEVISNPSLLSDSKYKENFGSLFALFEIDNKELIKLLYETATVMIFFKLLEAQNAYLTALSPPNRFGKQTTVNLQPSVYADYITKSQLSFPELLSFVDKLEKKYPYLQHPENKPDFLSFNNCFDKNLHPAVIEVAGAMSKPTKDIHVYYCSKKINMNLRDKLLDSNFTFGSDVSKCVNSDLTGNALFKELCGIYFDLDDVDNKYDYLIDEFKLLVFDSKISHWYEQTWDFNRCQYNLELIRLFHDQGQLDLPTLAMLVNREPKQPERNSYPHIQFRSIPELNANFFKLAIAKGVRFQHHPVLKGFVLGHLGARVTDPIIAFCCRVALSLMNNKISLETAQRCFDVLEEQLSSAKNVTYRLTLDESNFHDKNIEQTFKNPADTVAQLKTSFGISETDLISEDQLQTYIQRHDKELQMLDLFSKTYQEIYQQEVTSSAAFKDIPISIDRIQCVATAMIYLSADSSKMKYVLQCLNSNQPLNDFSSAEIRQVLSLAVDRQDLTVALRCRGF